MAGLDELLQSLEADGEDMEQFKTPVEEVIEQPPEPPGVVDQLLSPAKSLVNDPVGTVAAGVRGAQKAAFDFVPNLTEKMEGTMKFPIIRGAEMAASLFLPEGSQKPDFTTYRQVVEESILLTESLKQRAPGVVEGTELGVVGVSVAQLAKQVATKGPRLIGKLGTKIKQFQANRQLKKATKLTKELLKEGDGPILDAIVNRPEKVMKKLAENPESVLDLADDLGDQLSAIEDGLGKNVGSFRKNFVVDPTTKVDATEPQQLIKSFRESVTSSEGVNVLEPRQIKRLDVLEGLLTPKSSEAAGVVSGQALPSIKPKDAMLALDKIDEMTSLNEIAKGNISAAAVGNLLDVRKSLKAQIRGNNKDWAIADDLFSRYKDESARFASRLDSDSAESFVNNLFGKNKQKQRERLAKALDFADHVDTKVVGNGNAFFRRLAELKAADRVEDVNIALIDPLQDNVNNMMRKWVGRGRGVGLTVGSGVGGTLGGTPGGIFGASAGAAAGQELGRVVGRSMANPQRIFKAALKSKKLSKQAKDMANDLVFIHKNFGNNGVISMMDILYTQPALAELTKFGTQLGAPKQEEK